MKEPVMSKRMEIKGARGQRATVLAIWMLRTSDRSLFRKAKGKRREDEYTNRTEPQNGGEMTFGEQVLRIETLHDPGVRCLSSMLKKRDTDTRF
jgi:hypothetical protein